MADRLVIKGDDLLEAYNKIVYLHGEFDAATSRSDDAASSVGHPGLKGELENVADSWRIRRGKILESLTDIESQIKGTLDTFHDIDTGMADGFRGDGGQQQGPNQGGEQAPVPAPPATRPGPAPTPTEPHASPAPTQDVPLPGAGRPARTEDRQDTAEPATPEAAPPGQLTVESFPPEMQVLLQRLQALTTSPDFIAKYPEFAAGASLGALLPLLFAANAGHAGVRSGSGGETGPHSARDEVRELLQGVRKDAADGHLDAVTPHEARAELERLLGGTDATSEAGATEEIALEPDAQADQSLNEPDAGGPTLPPGAALATDEASTSQAEASSGGSGAGGSGSKDFRAGSPMLDEDPSSVGEVPSTPPAGDEPGAAETRSVATDSPASGTGSSSTPSAEGVSSGVPTEQAPQAPSSTSAGSTGVTHAPAAGHIPTPMMPAGSMGSGSAGGSSVSSGGSSSSQGGAAATATSSGASSSRTAAEKTSETRKAEGTDAGRIEGNAR